LTPFSRSPDATLSKIDIGREGFGPLEHHAHHASYRYRVDSLAVEVGAVELHAAGDVAPRDHLVHPVQRAIKVDFPHPDGPMNAVHVRGSTVIETSSTA
jgi:hypothetical protein